MEYGSWLSMKFLEKNKNNPSFKQIVEGILTESKIYVENY